MDKFSVNQLARLAKVSVRTLHYYDRIGLLKPGTRSEAKYRYYGEAELLRLQQILFYKEMDLSLAQIAEILDDPGFDTLKALQAHKKEMQARKARTAELLRTIDKTINHLKNKTMDPEEMYNGFSREQSEAYEKEARERWGDAIVEESKQRVKDMGKAGLAALKQEGDAINSELAALMDLPVTDKKVQALVKRHYHMISQYYTVTPEIYRGLGEMYVSDERFRSHYDKHKAGLAAFLRDAMHAYD